MELTTWKVGVEQHQPALEVFFQNVLLRKYNVKLQDLSKGSNEEAVEKLRESAVIVRAIEGNFETEVVMGFSEPWITQVSKAILDVDQKGNNEITKDLFQEVVSNLLKIIAGSFADIGIELEIIDIEAVKVGNLNRALNLKKYLTASFSLEPKFTVDGDDPQNLDFTVALAQPNRNKVEMLEIGFSEENPFLNEEYQDTCRGYAGQIDFERVNSPSGDTDVTQEKARLTMSGKRVEFENFSKDTAVENSREVRNINILKNVNMSLSVELGRRQIPLGKILKLVKGSVIELDKLAGDPVEVLVNGQIIARGDVVVIDEHFGVRITDMLATKEHIREMG